MKGAPQHRRLIKDMYATDYTSSDVRRKDEKTTFSVV